METPRATVVTTVHNEAKMLGYWLRHHRRIFDDGIVVDYGSSDDTHDIFLQEAPKHWKFIQSRNIEWDFWLCDREIMEIEESIQGWKMALNVTEFLLHDDLHEYLSCLNKDVHGVATTGIVMVDSTEERDLELDQRDLFLQRRHGYLEEDAVPVTNTNPRMRSRLLHRLRNGRYELGRHRYGVPAIRDPQLFLLWFGYSPWIIQRERKLQFKGQMSARNIAERAGLEHTRGADELWADYQRVLDRSYNIYDTIAGLREMEERFRARIIDGSGSRSR